MFTSSAEVFRLRQSLADLRSFLHASGPSVLARMEGLPSAAINRLLDGGARFSLPHDLGLYEATLLAAARPDEDYPAFVFATALLLADRLQSGDGTDDLYWFWDSFHEEYAVADPPVRAALMNGFRTARRTRRVLTEEPPRRELCLTRTRAEVESLLSESGDADAVRLLFAATDVVADAWAEADAASLSQGRLALFRYAYESQWRFRPPRPAEAALIPWRWL